MNGWQSRSALAVAVVLTLAYGRKLSATPFRAPLGLDVGLAVKTGPLQYGHYTYFGPIVRGSAFWHGIVGWSGTVAAGFVKNFDDTAGHFAEVLTGPTTRHAVGVFDIGLLLDAGFDFCAAAESGIPISCRRWLVEPKARLGVRVRGLRIYVAGGPRWMWATYDVDPFLGRAWAMDFGLAIPL